MVAVTAAALGRGASPTTSKMRASDADRQAAVAVLQDAIARGLLTPAEGSERMQTAFAAVHQGDLAPITADLPVADSPPGPHGWTLLLIFLEQLQVAVRRAVTDRHRPARMGAALLLAFVLISGGLLVAHVIGDVGAGGGPFRGHVHR